MNKTHTTYESLLLYALLTRLDRHQAIADRIMFLVVLAGIAAIVYLNVLYSLGLYDPSVAMAPACAGYHRAMAGL